MDTEIVYKQTILPADLGANQEFYLVNQGQVHPVVIWCALHMSAYQHNMNTEECLTISIPPNYK